MHTHILSPTCTQPFVSTRLFRSDHVEGDLLLITDELGEFGEDDSGEPVGDVPAVVAVVVEADDDHV